ncbi:tetraacyldisaccharide 4'-kinase [Pseudobacteriovorax antillogorgiicola]|nr:tetraacyldisaccharide 4'-kinase [Pseudobacteriovorax antillogorgiicola]
MLPLSYLYGQIQAFRRTLFDRKILTSHRLPNQVISVGNLEVGGTGKSPVTVAIANYLLKQGFHPVIVTRGYRSGLDADDNAVLLDRELVLTPQSGKDFHADEARMQSALLPSVPVIIGAKRIDACRRFLAHFPEPTHWLLDDGFQHCQIKRDLDIVLLDADRPLDNGHVIPCGRLREFPGTLERADIILLTRARSNQVPPVLQNFRDRIRFSTFEHKSLNVVHSSRSGEPFPTQDLAVITGIAKPQKLLTSVQELGLGISQTHIVRDHEPFRLREIKDKIKNCRAVLTTEKDYFRDPSIFDELSIPVATLPLSADIQEIHKSLVLSAT